MDEKTKNIIDGLRKQHMSSAEKDVLKKRVFSHMQSHSLPTPSPYGSFYSFFRTQGSVHTMRTVFAGFLIFILTSSTLTYAAEQSLPGDPLYPVKTNITEGVLRVFSATTPENAVSFETSLMEKRLVEAELLEKKNKLTKINRDTVEAKIGEQEERVRVAFARLPQSENESFVAQATAVQLDSTPSAPQADEQSVSATTSVRFMSVQTNSRTKKIQKKQVQESGLRAVNNDVEVNKKVEEISQVFVPESVDEHIETVFEKHKDIVKKMKEEKNREEGKGNQGDSRGSSKGKGEEND